MNYRNNMANLLRGQWTLIRAAFCAGVLTYIHQEPYSCSFRTDNIYGRCGLMNAKIFRPIDLPFFVLMDRNTRSQPKFIRKWFVEKMWVLSKNAYITVCFYVVAFAGHNKSNLRRKLTISPSIWYSYQTHHFVKHRQAQWTRTLDSWTLRSTSLCLVICSNSDIPILKLKCQRKIKYCTKILLTLHAIIDKSESSRFIHANDTPPFLPPHICTRNKSS